MLSWCARCVYRSGCCTPTPSPNAGKINPRLIRTVWCFLPASRLSMKHTELNWLAIITFSHTKLITANILAGLEFFMSSVLLPIFITRCWQRSIIRLSLLHFSKTARDLDCICACLCIWYGRGTNKVTWGEKSLVPIPWERAETRICWSADLLKCGFARMQICKNTAAKSMCNSSNLLISHLEMAHSHLATFTHWP